MKYVPSAVPHGMASAVRLWLSSQLRLISEAMEAPDFSLINLAPRSAEPQRISEGDIVNADGVNWNPGSGAGVYVRRSAAWVKLG